jgi:hypothetical protein
MLCCSRSSTSGPRPSARQRALALYEQLADAARHVPGASHAAISAITPVSGSVIDVVVQAEGGSDPVLPRDVSYRNVITPDWFTTYGTRLVAGRDFESRDGLGRAPRRDSE